MLKLNQSIDRGYPADTIVSLSFEQRQRSHLRVVLANGQDAGITLPRGKPMQPGDKLLSDSGQVVEVVAKPERVSIARVDDSLLFAKACYHLGNRHVKLQIEQQALSYQYDHVLDGLLASLGIEVIIEERPFEPEPGAYHGGHAHVHEHEHEH